MPCTYTSDETDGTASSATKTSDGNSSPKRRKTQKERNERKNKLHEHQENIHPIGYVDEEYMAMVHTEVKHEHVKRIPKAKQAVDDEWDKLINMGAFGMTEFKDMKAVKRQYDKDEKPVRFGNLIAICHEQHSELPKDQRNIYGARRLQR